MPAIPVPSNTLFAQNRTGIQEVLGPAITAIMQSDDPFMRDIPITSAGVTRDEIGREYVINRLFYERAITGNFEPMHGVGRNDFLMYGEGLRDAAGNYQKYDKPTKTVPSPFGGLLPKPFRLRTPIRGYIGNFPMSLTMMDYDQNNATILKLIQETVENVALGASTQILNAFWLDNGQSYSSHRLADLGANSGAGAYTVDDSAKTITFYPSHQAIARFVRGAQVDLWVNVSNVPKRMNSSIGALSTSNMTEANRVRVWVKDVVPEVNKVVLAWEPGTSDATKLKSVDGTESTPTSATRFNAGGTPEAAAGNEGLGTANVCYITYANQWANTTELFKGLFGVHHVMRFGSGYDDGYIYGGEAITGEDGSYPLGGRVSVADHPSLKSVRFVSVGQLTEGFLNKAMDRFVESKGMFGYDVDTWVTTRGVMRAYQKNVEARMTRIRDGLSSLSMEGNTGDWKYAYEGGKSVTIKMNRFIEKGRLYGLKLQNNWEICVPPFMQQKGGKNAPNMQKWVPVDFFGGRLMGTNSPYMPYTVTESAAAGAEVRATEWTMCPYRAMLQFVAKQLPGFMLDGITEDKLYADA